jgi:hypothetical protein
MPQRDKKEAPFIPNKEKLEKVRLKKHNLPTQKKNAGG